MIKKYIKKLIKNIPKTDNIETIDLVLEGGVFNGGYQIGILLFLKEMEKHKKIKIDKMTGCSCGAFGAILYHLNKLDMAVELFEELINFFKKNKNMSIIHTLIDEKLRPILPPNFHKQISNKIFINYYDVKKQKKIIRSKYKSIEDVINILKRSSFVPFLINGDTMYDNNYIDGIFPYILKCNPNKKVLYIDLCGENNLKYMFSVKNENNVYHRLLTGILDIHLFFIKKTNTQMCSYVNNWSTYLWVKNKIFKYVIEKILFYILFFYVYLKNLIDSNLKNVLLLNLMYKIKDEFTIQLIDNYCL